MPTHVCVCARVWIRKLVAAGMANFQNLIFLMLSHLSSLISNPPSSPLPSIPSHLLKIAAQMVTCGLVKGGAPLL